MKETNKTRDWLVNARKDEKISLLALSKKIGLAYPSAYKIEMQIGRNPMAIPTRLSPILATLLSATAPAISPG